MLACLDSYGNREIDCHRTKVMCITIKDPNLRRQVNRPQSIVNHVHWSLYRHLTELTNHKEEYYGERHLQLLSILSRKRSEKLREYGSERINRVSSIIRRISVNAGFDNLMSSQEISHNEEVLANMAIGAPAMCLYRIFERLGDDNAKTHAEDVAKDMIAIFNNRQGIAAVRNNCRNHGTIFWVW